MNLKLLLEYAMFAELLIGVVTLVVIGRKGLLCNFYFLAGFVAVSCIEEAIAIPMLFFRRELGISKVTAYDTFATSHWVCSAIEYVFFVLAIYSVFSTAMRPLQGLHRAGQVVFRWVCCVSVALALGIAIGPHVSTSAYISTVTSQVQQGMGVLTLCLLLFVCFSTRYLGLTYRSHIFGVSLGLGIWATFGLIQTAWYAGSSAQGVYSPVYLFGAIGACIGLLTWTTYFAMAAPAHKMILLPTTSPFFLWNRISEALGDDPGFVAVAGFKPDMLAPAELKVLTAASRRLQQHDAEDALDREFAAREAASYQPMAMQR